MLEKVVSKIPVFSDENLLVGFETSDDGAVYKVSDDVALIQTLDFFTPMVADPYLFGKIAAANALSDVYAMGGKVSVAMNIVCFPEEGDIDVLSEILRGGGEKVKEAKGVLCGGHSVSDKEIKYGLSVTGLVHPDKYLRNNTCKNGDVLILTKPLGTGMVTAAYGFGEVDEGDYQEAVLSMQMLNKYAFEAASKYRLHAGTDVTGFGFLGHLNEMVTKDCTIAVESNNVRYIKGAMRLAEEFLITAGAQKNRNFVQDKVKFMGTVSAAMQEILLDPQTSGGLLLSVDASDASALMRELDDMEVKSCVVGEVQTRKDKNIIIY
jgi:selenide,water dikinase